MATDEHGLKPCPFCGSAAEQRMIDDKSNPDHGGSYIECTNALCGCTTNLRFGDCDAPLRSIWNSRESEPNTDPQLEYFLRMVREEVARARKKFPMPNLTFPALIEEVGEVGKALLEAELGLVGNGEVYCELVQSACMCARLATEGDTKYNQGLPFTAQREGFPPPTDKLTSSQAATEQRLAAVVRNAIKDLSTAGRPSVVVDRVEKVLAELREAIGE